jgi:hypothetical protein
LAVPPKQRGNYHQVGTGIIPAHGALIVALIQYVKQANLHRINIASHFLTKAGTLNAP